MGSPIYLDYNATTPIAPEVIEAMLPALRENWGNPSSAHAYGRRARRAVEHSRGQVAELLGCEPGEIIFTSGGTESDNAAIVGIAEGLEHRGRHVVTSAIEHQAVEESCVYLERRGWSVTRIGVDADGLVDSAAVENAIRPDTTLISIMHANNETGVIQPVEEIRRFAEPREIVVHTDAAQAVGKIGARVDDLNVDALTVAGHKLYGPKGVGALYLRRGTPFAGFMRGAGHEGGRRSGTEDVAEIVGFGAACRLAVEELPGRTDHLRALRDRLEANLRARLPDLVVHGGNVERLPNTLYAAIPGVEAVQLLARAEGVASAAGAACHSDEAHVSRTLKAMGVADALALSTLRLTVGRPTTMQDVDLAAERIADAAEALRALPPGER